MNVMPLEWKSLTSLLSHPAMGKVVTMVNLAVLVLLSHSLANLTWRIVPAPRSAAPPPAMMLGAGPAKAASSGGAAPVARIAGWHLFGNAAQQGQSDVPPQEALPETQLNLTLRGVLAVDDKRRAQAIIAQPNGQEKPYGIGDSLPGGAVLKDIRPTNVVLLRNNRYETLSLPKEELNDQQSMMAQTAPPGAPVPSLREVRHKLLTDPESLSGLIRTQPYRGARGQLMGFRIQPGRNKALFNHYGLRPGDIVTSINGVALNNASNVFQILRGLSSRDNVNIQLIRNGSPQSLTLHIQ